MFFQKIYNFLIHSRSVLLFAFVVETAIAGTIPAQKGSLYKTDWRFIQESISKMKLDENWPQKQQALQAYATSYVQSKKNKNYETSLDKGIRFYTNYDKLAQILSNGDKRLYKLLLANQNAFDNLVILSLSKHKTLENSFKRIKNAQAMEWVIIFSLLGIIGINNLRKYHYLNDLHEDLLNHYTKFFATFYVILFAYLTYLFAGPATLGSPRRVCAGLQKTLAKEATNKYHENFFYQIIYPLPQYQTNQQYQTKLNQAKLILENYKQGNNDYGQNTDIAIEPQQENVLGLDAEIMAHGNIYEAYHAVKSFYDKQNLDNYYILHPERKPKKTSPIPATTPQNAIQNKKPQNSINPTNIHNTKQPIPQKKPNQYKTPHHPKQPTNTQYTQKTIIKK